VIAGETVIAEVVAPVLHLYLGVPPMDVTLSVALLPEHIESFTGDSATADETLAMALINTDALSLQNLLDPTTFKVESLVMIKVIELVVAPVFHL
jgi:hypothetical protein